LCCRCEPQRNCVPSGKKKEDEEEIVVKKVWRDGDGLWLDDLSLSSLFRDRLGVSSRQSIELTDTRIGRSSLLLD
jgi:hypothetical protein